jgi:hypothetical protein
MVFVQAVISPTTAVRPSEGINVLLSSFAPHRKQDMAHRNTFARTKPIDFVSSSPLLYQERQRVEIEFFGSPVALRFHSPFSLGFSNSLQWC